MEFELDLSKIPRDPEGVQRYVGEMIDWAEEGLRRNLGGDYRDLDLFAKAVLRYTVLQLRRIRNPEAVTDLLAWSARALFEMLLWTRYALASPERLRDYMLLKVRDYDELDRKWYVNGQFSASEEDEQAFRSSVASMKSAIEAEDWTIPERWNFGRLAKEAGEEDLYNTGYKLLSKYVHPTPMMLFGKESFVHGSGARDGILVFAQYSAAALLSGLPGAISRLRSEKVRREHKATT